MFYHTHHTPWYAWIKLSKCESVFVVWAEKSETVSLRKWFGFLRAPPGFCVRTHALLRFTTTHDLVVWLARTSKDGQTRKQKLTSLFFCLRLRVCNTILLLSIHTSDGRLQLNWSAKWKTCGTKESSTGAFVCVCVCVGCRFDFRINTDYSHTQTTQKHGSDLKLENVLCERKKGLEVLQNKRSEWGRLRARPQYASVESEDHIFKAFGRLCKANAVN